MSEPGEARLSRAASAAVRTAIRLAGGNEVCFVCSVDDEGMITAARVVARGDVRSVLAMPGVAERGEMLLHNHPSGGLTPSDADLDVAARVHGNGVGFAITDNDGSLVYVVTEVPRAGTKVSVDIDAIDVTLGNMHARSASFQPEIKRRRRWFRTTQNFQWYLREQGCCLSKRIVKSNLSSKRRSATVGDVD